ncbi:TPA: hypothetical protein ROU65_004246 [Raoultella ornithinolytica]|nr:hypothetical protein [Raoultella ornithinolytica]HDX8337377.1 hypothetical protein [Raoultella ornithinolytica]
MSYFEPVLFSDPKEFERYVCEYFSILYDTRFSTYGTPGQNQNGIDGLHFGPSNDGKKHVIQCKNLNHSDLTLQIIQDDINKAKELKVEFDVFHFVTSAKKKTKIQNDISNNMDVLTNNNYYEFEIHFYSDFFNDSIKIKEIVDKYFNFLSTTTVESKYKRDISNIVRLAKGIDSAFVDVPYYISIANKVITPAYSTLEAINYFDCRTSSCGFYDQKLNLYIEMFIDYRERINRYHLFYTYEPSRSESEFGFLNLVYNGERNELSCIKGHLLNLVENFSETFQGFVTYIRDNYYEFEIHKNYYIYPFQRR